MVLENCADVAPAAPGAGTGLPFPGMKWSMFLLAGQSNMAGRGPLSERCASLAATPDERIAVLGADGAWRVPASHPLHWDKPDKVGVGPGLEFARAVVDFLPEGEQRVGLLPYAFGGSELARWAPEGGDLFAAAVASVRRGAEAGGQLVGVLWHQGESDSGSEGDAASYADRLRSVIRELRSQCGLPGVPMVLGELGVHFLDMAGDARFRFAVRVNRAIAEVAASAGPGIAVASARGLAHRGDRLHFSAEAADTLGRRYAWQWLQLAGRAHGSLRALLADGGLEPPLLSEEGEGALEPRPGRGSEGEANCAAPELAEIS